MFSYIKNYKLNKFLSDCCVTSHPQDRIFFYHLETGYLKIFDISTVQGSQNYKKLISNLYSQKDQKIRLKMMMVIHFLFKKHTAYSDVFLENYQNQFNGSVQNYTNKHSSFVYTRQNSTQSKILTPTTSSHVSIGNFKSMTSIKNYEQQYSNVHNYIYLHLILPYHTYLIKLASSQQRYHNCITNLPYKTSVYDSNECWKFLNILKSVSIIKIPITNIGRYYKQQVKSIVDFIQLISYDLILYKTELEKQLQHAFSCYWLLKKQEIESVLLQTEELLKENENLFEIFKNRYYYPEPVHQVEPKWFAVEEGGVEMIEQYYAETFSVFPEGLDKDGNSKTDRSITTTCNSIKYQ